MLAPLWWPMPDTARENAMRKAIIAALLICLLTGTAYGIGYTVFVRQQVIPQYTQVGDIQVLNPGETPAYPSTFRTMVCRPASFSIYSADEADRKEVWEDYNGTATDTDITGACGPIWNYNNPSQ